MCTPMPPSRRVAPVLIHPCGKAMGPVRAANLVSVEWLVPVN